jgi:hypothetical protein
MAARILTFPDLETTPREPVLFRGAKLLTFSHTASSMPVPKDLSDYFLHLPDIEKTKFVPGSGTHGWQSWCLPETRDRLQFQTRYQLSLQSELHFRLTVTAPRWCTEIHGYFLKRSNLRNRWVCLSCQRKRPVIVVLRVSNGQALCNHCGYNGSEHRYRVLNVSRDVCGRDLWPHLDTLAETTP